MARVTGIGGFFFKGADPAGLSDWYERHLGLTAISKGPWFQEAGPTVHAPFSADSDYFGRPEQKWMLNLRVDDLDGMIESLTAAGIAVETRAEWDSAVGRFARIHDPEGNPVELWQPAAMPG